MTESLARAQEENERERWLKTGHATLLDQMRGEQDLPTLSRTVITYLTKYLGAQVGVIYTTNSTEALHLTGSYAYPKRKKMIRDLDPGEGLAGQAVLERETIVVRDIPDDYVQINSTLGESAPKNLVMCPLIADTAVTGCLEIGSFESISDKQLDLLHSVSESVAIAIVSAQTRSRMKELLDDSQAQAEQLQSQQEELKSANEELEEQTRGLKASEEELKQQGEELKASNEELQVKTNDLETQQVRIEGQKTQLEASKLDLERRAEELRLASKYKTEFLSNMSHELRTPLNSMLILSQSLADNKEGNFSESQIEAAKIVHSGGNDLLRLINEILDLSKIEAGQMQVNVEDVRLTDIVEALTKQFAPVAEDKKLDLDAFIGDGLPSSIRTDGQRLRQILKNLLSNAFKFTHEGSIKLEIQSVSSEAPLRHLDPAQQKLVALSVIDTGIGIPEDRRMAIFESFQQADGSVSRKYGGTGLGLTISRELARLLGGELHLEQGSEAGSTFTLYLPTTLGEVVEAPPVIAPRMTSTNVNSKEHCFFADDRELVTPDERSLLIIEDDVHFVRILVDLARQRGYKCLVTDLGREGLVLAEQLQPSAILLDLGLPDVDGTIVLEQLKDNMKTRHIPVHVASARDPDQAILRKGAVGFLEKPATAADLDELMTVLAERNENRVRRILIVEDDANSQAAITDLIQHTGIELTMAETGEKALEILASDPYDCIILDLTLPGISGYEVLERLSTATDSQPPPVIVYTGAELTREQNRKLEGMTQSIVVKGAGSGERIIDDLALFLHTVEADLPERHREVIRSIHDPKLTLEGRTVLIVDDDTRNVFALSKVLSEEGLVIQSADNGKLGVEKLEADPTIELVIMDIMMPVMDGLEAIRLIRLQQQYSGLPIIALTAKAMPKDRENCLEAGASEYITKPVDSDQLFRLLRIWLHKST